MKNVKFDLPLLIPPRAADGVWTLGRPWRVDWGEVSFVLPKGFGTDGASIPRALWRVCGTPLDVPRLYAALVHDWLYSGDGPRVTRAEADAVYRDMQIALGVLRVKAYAEWAALRIFGASHWEGVPDAESKALQIVTVCALAAALLAGCAYRGGKVVDGANLAIGMTIPGTEWSINALDYVGGVRVAGQDSTKITVTNDVDETNSYFGVVSTRRKTRMVAEIEPMANPAASAD